MTDMVRYVSKAEEEHCGKIHIESFPDEIILGKDIITTYKVLTRNGNAKHSNIDG